MKKTLSQQLASAVVARRNCEKHNNQTWRLKWTEEIDRIEKEFLPSGSGIDNGCKVDLERTSETKLVIHTSFHHMDDHGSYSGWTEHTITAIPTFIGLNIQISGRDKRGIKDYLADVFHTALSEEYTPNEATN